MFFPGVLPRRETWSNCPRDRGRMSDSEGSVEESVRESGNAREETVVAVANREDTGGDKLEEFEKLLRAMLPSRAASQEEEEPEENESERKIGAFLMKENTYFFHPSPFLQVV